MELKRITETREIVDYNGIRLSKITDTSATPNVRYEYGAAGSLQPGNTAQVFYAFNEYEGLWLRDMFNAMMPVARTPRRKTNGTKS